MLANFLKIVYLSGLGLYTLVQAQTFNPIQENVRFIQSLLQKPGHDFRSERFHCAFVPDNTLFDCAPAIRFRFNEAQRVVTLTETVSPDVYKLSDGLMLGSRYFLYWKKGFRYAEPHIMIKVNQLQRTCTFELWQLDTALCHVDEKLGIILVFRGRGAQCQENLKADLFIEPGDSLRQEAWDFMEYHAPDRFTELKDEDLYSCKRLLNYSLNYSAERISFTPDNAHGERKKILRSLKTLYKYALKAEGSSGDGN